MRLLLSFTTRVGQVMVFIYLAWMSSPVLVVEVEILDIRRISISYGIGHIKRVMGTFVVRVMSKANG